MISKDEAHIRAAREMVADPSVIGIEEFDAGYLAWRLSPPREDLSRPPDTVGGSHLVVDKDTEETSAWPLLDPSLIMDQFRRVKCGEEVNWGYDNRD